MYHWNTWGLVHLCQHKLVNVQYLHQTVEEMIYYYCLTGDDQLGVRLRAQERFFMVRIWLPPLLFSINTLLSSFIHGKSSSYSSVHAVDLSMETELLPPYKVIILSRYSVQFSLSCCWLLLTVRLSPQVLILSLSDLSSVTHLVVSASNLNGKQVLETSSPLLSVSLYFFLLCCCEGRNS